MTAHALSTRIGLRAAERANNIVRGIFVHEVDRGASGGGSVSSCAVPGAGLVVVDAPADAPSTVSALNALYRRVRDTLESRRRSGTVFASTPPKQ